MLEYTDWLMSKHIENCEWTSGHKQISPLEVNLKAAKKAKFIRWNEKKNVVDSSRQIALENPWNLFFLSATNASVVFWLQLEVRWHLGQWVTCIFVLNLFSIFEILLLKLRFHCKLKTDIVTFRKRSCAFCSYSKGNFLLLSRNFFKLPLKRFKFEIVLHKARCFVVEAWNYFFCVSLVCGLFCQ